MRQRDRALRVGRAVDEGRVALEPVDLHPHPDPELFRGQPDQVGDDPRSLVELDQPDEAPETPEQ